MLNHTFRNPLHLKKYLLLKKPYTLQLFCEFYLIHSLLYHQHRMFLLSYREFFLILLSANKSYCFT